jgi:hypothetical protein
MNAVPKLSEIAGMLRYRAERAMLHQQENLIVCGIVGPALTIRATANSTC